MESNDRNNFYEVLKRRIEAKVTIETENGCKLWRTKSKYPKMAVNFPGLGHKTYYVHRLVVMVNLRVSMLPKDKEVSHICHNKSCCNLDHLSFESHKVNAKRMTCKSKGNCDGHGEHPNCLF